MGDLVGGGPRLAGLASDDAGSSEDGSDGGDEERQTQQFFWIFSGGPLPDQENRCVGGDFSVGGS